MLWPMSVLCLIVALLCPVTAWAAPASEIEKGFLAEIKANPEDGAAYYALGLIRFKESRLAEANYYFKSAARLMPDDPNCRVRLGMTLERMGLTERARAMFGEALKLDPDHAEARAHLEPPSGGDDPGPAIPKDTSPPPIIFEKSPPPAPAKQAPVEKKDTSPPKIDVNEARAGFRAESRDRILAETRPLVAVVDTIPRLRLPPPSPDTAVARRDTPAQARETHEARKAPDLARLPAPKLQW